MRSIAKNEWRPSISVKEAADIMVDWCIKAREKNILRKSPSRIFYAYVLDGSPQLNFLQDIGKVFKYSQKDTPYVDELRDSLLRCLSVALKAHYFLFQGDRVAHEPYFFVLPDFDDKEKMVTGLIYKIEKDNKTIVVSSADLKLLYKKPKIVFEFPVALTANSFEWYHLKNWAKVKHSSRMDSGYANKPWIDTKNIELAKQAKTAQELSQYATILDIPFELKDEFKPLGIEWSKNVKVWYLAKGFDLASVSEYIDFVKATRPKQITE